MSLGRLRLWSCVPLERTPCRDWEDRFATRRGKMLTRVDPASPLCYRDELGAPPATGNSVERPLALADTREHKASSHYARLGSRLTPTQNELPT